MNEKKLYPRELSRGPDLLRPGSSTGRYGQGRWAFIVTKYPNHDGQRFHKEPAGTGHEEMITRPEILQGLFGPELDKVLPAIRSSKEEYEYKNGRYEPTGRTTDNWDYWAIREKSMETSLYGRYGTVRDMPVVMLWQAVPGWETMLKIAVKELQIPDEAVLVIGTEERGTVGESSGVKDDPKERERMKLLAQYHTAIGANKMALKKMLGLDKRTAPPYPDTSKMTQDQIDEYPWTRQHWRDKAKEAGIPGVFDYGEANLAGFKKWLTRCHYPQMG
jgi:hypothetical protein